MFLDGVSKHLVCLTLTRNALEIVVEVEKDGDETEQCVTAGNKTFTATVADEKKELCTEFVIIFTALPHLARMPCAVSEII